MIKYFHSSNYIFTTIVGSKIIFQLIFFSLITFSKYSLHLSFITQGINLHGAFTIIFFSLSLSFAILIILFFFFANQFWWIRRQTVTQSINPRKRDCHDSLDIDHITSARRASHAQWHSHLSSLNSVHRPSQSSRAEHSKKINFKLISHEVVKKISKKKHKTREGEKLSFHRFVYET